MKHWLRIVLLGIFIQVGSVPLMAGELIAYSHLTEGYWQIWVMAPDGRGKRQVTRSPQDKRDPVFMDQGQGIGFRNNNGQLYTVDLTGENEKEILSQYKSINNPHYSQILNRCVFVRYDPRLNDISEIWTAGCDGEDVRLLTTDKVLKYQPRFSPDGKWITYVKSDPQNKAAHHIWIMSSDGSQKKKLSAIKKGYDTLPDFSPDGQKIVMTSSREDQNYEIYTLEVKSGAVKRLTQEPGLDTHARYSPDGKDVIFVSDRDGSRRIWRMSAEGTSPVVLTPDQQDCAEPVWGIAADDSHLSNPKQP
jgi:Tol biopolymer transport system component